MNFGKLLEPFIVTRDLWVNGGAVWGRGVVLLDLIVASSVSVLWLCFLVSMLKTCPPRRISRLYPFKVHMRSLLPFSDRWREDIAPEHVEAIGKSRKMFLVFFTAFLILALLKFAYYEFFFVRLHSLR
jgi:hypothetical protein